MNDIVAPWMKQLVRSSSCFAFGCQAIIDELDNQQED